jgi:flagellar basal body rod protein FlgB
MTVRKRQDEERFNQAYQLTNPSVGNHVNVTKKMITPTHVKRKYQAAIDMLEPTLGCVTKQVKNNCHILHSRQSGKFQF